ncbi:ribonuclease J [Candidatus Nomurabacteria bacterium]|nr:ribonuclease J [Candidatus Nomurabacteria bacterium]
MRRVQRRPRSNHNHLSRNRGDKRNNIEIPPVGDAVRIIPLGGVEEVGKNMTAIEIGNDIIVIDAGFQFKDENTPGIDYILPNTKYLEERKDRIKGLFITHGHLDHIGAIPYIIDKIGNPPIYSRQFGAIMIQKRQEEFPHLPKINMNIIDKDETIVISEQLKVETFSISHTIPDSMGLILHTHQGDIVFIEDVRVDNIGGVPTEEEEDQYKRFKGKEVVLLTMDSTSIEKPGWSLSESVVAENIKKIMSEVSGRLIIATFASQVERIVAIVETAQKYGKKVIIEGRSMKSNIEIAKLLKLLDTDNIAPLTDLDNLPPDKVVMLVTGGQGEEFAALTRMANNSHKYVKLRETDTVLLSSSIIPTNHNSIVRLKDNLYRSKAKIITYLDSDVHASGHGNKEELKWIHEHIKYKFFMPVHGNHYMLRQHAELSQSIGTSSENIVVPDNGSVIEIKDNGNKIEVLPMKAPNELVTVDGFSISDVQDVVLRDRQMLSEAGIFVIVASINAKTGRLKKSPDIISRGFVYLRESQDLLREARNIIKRTIERNIRGKRQIDFDALKDIVAKEMSQYLFQQTAKEPLVIPVILGV